MKATKTQRQNTNVEDDKMTELDKKKWVRKPYTAKELEKLACANGSIACGLRQKLRTGKCDAECKKRMLLLKEGTEKMKGKVKACHKCYPCGHEHFYCTIHMKMKEGMK